MEDFYADLKSRAGRMRSEDFVAYVKGPVLLFDAPEEGEVPWMTGAATSIESTILVQSSIGEPAGGGDGDEPVSTRSAQRLRKRGGDPNEPISIGRSDECDIVVDHHSISKVHAYIKRESDGSFWIADAGSRNGLTLNGRRVDPETPLKIRPDDVIRIGSVMARLVYPKPLQALLLDQVAPTSMWRRLRDRTFLKFWGAEACAFIADSLYKIVLVAWIMSRSATGGGGVLGAIGVFQIAALMVTLLFGGILVDRMPRARVLVLSYSIRGIVATAAASLELYGHLETWHIYIAAALMGVGEAFNMPASAALLPEIVRREDLPSANALNTISIHSANITGPIIGAALSAAGGHTVSFSVVALFFMGAALFASRVQSVTHKTPPRRGAAPTGTLGSAARVMFANPQLWITSLIYALTLSIGFASAVVALPVLIKRSLHVNMSYYNACQSLFSVGALIGSVWLVHYLRRFRRGPVAYGTAIVYGLCILSAALPITIYGIAAAWLVRGIAVTVIGLIWVGMLQQLIPRDMLGRAASIDAFLQVSLTSVTFLGYGALTETIAPELVFVIGGVVLCLAPVIALMHPKIRHMGSES